MESLSNNDWIFFTEKQIDDALGRILQHKQATAQFTMPNIHKAYGRTFDYTFPETRIRHGMYKECAFEGATLSAVTFNGALFDETSFTNTRIENTSMQSCNFSSSSFNNCKLLGSNMSQSFFWRTRFSDTHIFGTTLLQSTISECTFHSCDIKSVSFEACALERVQLENMRLANLNLEYAEFNGIVSHEVIFPFAQLPFIFGGLTYVLNTKDTIGISSHKNGNVEISVEEYYAALQDLMIYYWSIKEYFPLANICHALGMWPNAKKSMQLGLDNALDSKNYRMLKFFCKQAAGSNLFTPVELRGIYRKIEAESASFAMTENEYHNLMLHLPGIKNVMLDCADRFPSLRLTFFTNIDASDFGRLEYFMQVIDKSLEMIGDSDCAKRMEVRHNSDYVVDLIVSGGWQAIWTTFSICYLLLSATACSAKLISTIRKVSYDARQEERAAEMHKEDMLDKMQDRKIKNEQHKMAKETHEIEIRLKQQQEMLNERQIETLLEKKSKDIQEGREELKAKGIVVANTIPFVTGPDRTVINSYYYSEMYKL